MPSKKHESSQQVRLAGARLQRSQYVIHPQLQCFWVFRLRFSRGVSDILPFLGPALQVLTWPLEFQAWSRDSRVFSKLPQCQLLLTKNEPEAYFGKKLDCLGNSHHSALDMSDVVSRADLLNTHDSVVGEEDSFFVSVVDITEEVVPYVA